MSCFFQIISEMLSEIYTVEEFDFLKSIIYSQIKLSVVNGIEKEK